MTSDPVAPALPSESEADVFVNEYISRIRRATSQLAPLYPLDSRPKVDEAIPLWDELYGAIGFTTADSEAEQRLLSHPELAALVPETRRAVRECEAAFEVAFADEAASSAVEGEGGARAAIARFPIHAFYEHCAGLEWLAALTVLGRTPRAVAILGAGALPETCIWIQDWARARGERVRVHNVEVVPSRLESSRLVVRALGLEGDDVTFEAGDATTRPERLDGFDVVYFNATVGETAADKERILIQVARRMRSGAVVLSRGSHALKSLFYPPTVMNTPGLMKALRPVLTCHMSGEHGRSINTSVIASRVV